MAQSWPRNGGQWQKADAIPVAPRILWRLCVDGSPSWSISLIGWFSQFSLEGQASFIRGEALDAHAGNAFILGDGEGQGYELIDQEWFLAKPMRKSWFVMRNLCTLDHDLITLLTARWSSLRELYEHLCTTLGIEAAFNDDMTTETHFACLLGDGEDLETVQSHLEDRFSTTFGERGFPRAHFELEGGNRFWRRTLQEMESGRDRLQAEVNKLRADNSELHALHQRKIYWGPRMIDQLIIRVRQLKRQNEPS